MRLERPAQPANQRVIGADPSPLDVFRTRELFYDAARYSIARRQVENLFEALSAVHYPYRFGFNQAVHGVVPWSFDLLESYCTDGQSPLRAFYERTFASAQEFAQRMELMPPAARGLDFRKFVSLREGMSEGELLTVAGSPDMQRRERSYDIYTYMPTPADPFVTTITLLRGRVQDLDRVRKF